MPDMGSAGMAVLLPIRLMAMYMQTAQPCSPGAVLHDSISVLATNLPVTITSNLKPGCDQWKLIQINLLRLLSMET